MNNISIMKSRFICWFKWKYGVPVALAVVLMYRILFSLRALISELSPAISVGWGLNTSSISLSMSGSLGPSPSVSTIESLPPVSASALDDSFSEFCAIFILLEGRVFWFVGFGEGVVEFLDVVPKQQTFYLITLSIQFKRCVR